METFRDREQLDISLGSYARAAQNHWVPALLTFGTVVALSTVAALSQAPTYQATAQLLFRSSRTPTLTGLAEGSQDFDTLGNNQNPLVTETKIITSQPILNEVVDTLGLTDDTGRPLNPAALRPDLRVEILPGADVVQIAYESTDPEQAAALVNTLTDVYIQGSFESTLAEATRARELIDQQLPQAEAFVRRSEQALRQFKEDNNVILLESQAESMVGLMGGLDSQILETQASLREAASRSDQLRSGLNLSPQEALLISDLSQSTGVQGALQRLQEVEQDLAVEQGFYTDTSPTVETLRNQQTNLQELLQQEVTTAGGSGSRYLQVGPQRQQMITALIDAEVQRNSLEQRLEVLANARTNYDSQAGTIPFLEQRLEELASQLQVERQNYQFLLQKQQELRLAESQASGNVVVLEPAVVPESPSNLRRVVIMALGILLGALLAMTVVFLLNLSDSRPVREHP